MADTFAKFNSSTHPIVKLEDDWNNLLDHGLHNFTGYYILTDGTYYSAINASTHKLVYGGDNTAGEIDGTDFDAVWTAVLTAIGDNGIVKLGSGTFYTDGLNVINSGPVTDTTQQWIEICGEGMGNTIIRGNSTATGAASNDGGFTDEAWLMIDSFNNSGIRVHVHDLKIFGDHSTNTNDVAGIILRYGRQSIIERVWIQECSKYGIFQVGPNAAYREAYIRDCIIYDIFDNDDTVGVPVENNCVGIKSTFADVYITNNIIGWIGYDWAGDPEGYGIVAEDSTIVDGNVIWVTDTGIFTLSGSSDQVIINNFVDFAYDVGIYIYETDRATVHNNTIRIPYADGIFLQNADKNSVQNNHFILRDTFTTNRYIVESGTSDYNSIRNNMVKSDGTVSVAEIDIVGSHSSVRDNYGFSFIGGGGTWFEDTDDIISAVASDSATPTASTDYTVCNSAIMIKSTDSGNTNCAILIKAENGTAMNTAASTLDGVYVPEGYMINWGAFTGAAPTVVISFVG